MQIVQTPPGRGVHIIKDHTYIDDADPTQAMNTWEIQIPSISF